MSTRLDAIKAHKLTEDAEKSKAIATKIAEFHQRELQILSLLPRIKELIETATECEEYGIRFSDFEANNASARFGFTKYDKKTWSIGYVGQFGGSAPHILVDGDGIRWVCQYSHYYPDVVLEYLSAADESIRLSYTTSVFWKMDKFIRSFDEFEAGFYKYVDGVCGKED